MNMIYGILLVPSMLLIYVISAYWISLRRLGFAGKVIRRVPSMLIFDLLAVSAALKVSYWAAHAWTG